MVLERSVTRVKISNEVSIDVMQSSSSSKEKLDILEVVETFPLSALPRIIYAKPS